MTLWSLYGGLYLSLYTKSKQWMRHWSGYREGHLPPLLVVPCAVVSASVAAALTNPMDVIKLHYQVKRETDSFWGILKSITNNYGVGVWTRGIFTRILWVAPRTAISFTVYDICKKFVG